MRPRIPSDDEIASAVTAALRRRRRIESQKALHAAVTAELGASGRSTSVTASRVRRVALLTGTATVEIHYRSTPQEVPAACPVCGCVMGTVTAVGLDGEPREVRTGCSSCPFTVSGRPRGPARYIFSAPREPPSGTQVRIRRLRRAAGMLAAAAALVRDTLDTTELAQRSEFISRGVEGIISDPEDPGSIENIIADLEQSGGPVWTRPFATPKYHDGTRRSLPAP